MTKNPYTTELIKDIITGFTDEFKISVLGSWNESDIYNLNDDEIAEIIKRLLV